MSRERALGAQEIALPAPPSGVRVLAEDRAAFVARIAREEEERIRARYVAEGEARAVASAAGALERAAERLEQVIAAARDELAHDAVELALEIARTILRREIDAQRYDLELIVREALQASGAGRGHCVVHLNPTDVARLSNVAFRAGTSLEADAEVAPGDVHVTTPRGLLVRDVEQAVASIGERLRGDLA